jgi:hypothetical protein
MHAFAYRSGEEVRTKDRVVYHDEPGEVEFVIARKTGDPGLDWYLEEFPGGGFMIRTPGFGNVFLTEEDIDEDLRFVSRGLPDVVG